MLVPIIMGGGEIILVLLLIAILLSARRLPEIGRGFGQGFAEFLKAMRQFCKEVDGNARDAGRSVGGIYGKAAFEAITAKNETAELYDPATVWKDGDSLRRRSLLWLRRLWRAAWNLIRGLLGVAKR